VSAQKDFSAAAAECAAAATSSSLCATLAALVDPASICYRESADGCLAAANSTCELSPFTGQCQPGAGLALAQLAGGPALAAQAQGCSAYTSAAACTALAVPYAGAATLVNGTTVYANASLTAASEPAFVQALVAALAARCARAASLAHHADRLRAPCCMRGPYAGRAGLPPRRRARPTLPPCPLCRAPSRGRHDLSLCWPARSAGVGMGLVEVTAVGSVGASGDGARWGVAFPTAAAVLAQGFVSQLQTPLSLPTYGAGSTVNITVSNVTLSAAGAPGPAASPGASASLGAPAGLPLPAAAGGPAVTAQDGPLGVAAEDQAPPASSGAGAAALGTLAPLAGAALLLLLAL
jgi:hypothetical protein